MIPNILDWDMLSWALFFVIVALVLHLILACLKLYVLVKKGKKRKSKEGAKK